MIGNDDFNGHDPKSTIRLYALALAVAVVLLGIMVLLTLTNRQIRQVAPLRRQAPVGRFYALSPCTPLLIKGTDVVLADGMLVSVDDQANEPTPAHVLWILDERHRWRDARSLNLNVFFDHGRLYQGWAHTGAPAPGARKE